MSAEGEAGHDPEVAAAASPAGPVEVAFVRGAAAAQDAVGGDDPQRDDIVRGRSPGARREADAAAEREAGDADGRARAGGDRGSVRRELRVDVDQSRAGADRRASVRDADPAQAPEIDDEPVARRIARVTVTARASDDRNAVPLRPQHGPAHVVRVRRPEHGEWADPVEARVEEEPRVLVRRSRRLEQRAADDLRERAQPGIAGSGCAPDEPPG